LTRTSTSSPAEAAFNAAKKSTPTLSDSSASSVTERL
jgi:hypothetical protein